MSKLEPSTGMRPENDPEYWLAKAAEARAAVERLTDPTARQHMLAAAEGFERLAELAKNRPVAKEPEPANDK